MRYDVLIAVRMTVFFFLVMTPCRLVCFSETSVYTYESTRGYNPKE
jgi:hypothetical protein